MELELVGKGVTLGERLNRKGNNTEPMALPLLPFTIRGARNSFKHLCPSHPRIKQSFRLAITWRHVGVREEEERCCRPKWMDALNFAASSLATDVLVASNVQHAGMGRLFNGIVGLR